MTDIREGADGDTDFPNCLPSPPAVFQIRFAVAMKKTWKSVFRLEVALRCPGTLRIGRPLRRFPPWTARDLFCEKRQCAQLPLRPILQLGWIQPVPM